MPDAEGSREAQPDAVCAFGAEQLLTPRDAADTAFELAVRSELKLAEVDVEDLERERLERAPDNNFPGQHIIRAHRIVGIENHGLRRGVGLEFSAAGAQTHVPLGSDRR